MPFPGSTGIPVGRGRGTWLPSRSQGEEGQVDGFVDRDLRSEPLRFSAQPRRGLWSHAAPGNPAPTSLRRTGSLAASLRTIGFGQLNDQLGNLATQFQPGPDIPPVVNPSPYAIVARLIVQTSQ